MTQARALSLVNWGFGDGVSFGFQPFLMTWGEHCQGASVENLPQREFRDGTQPRDSQKMARADVKHQRDHINNSHDFHIFTFTTHKLGNLGQVT